MPMISLVLIIGYISYQAENSYVNYRHSRYKEISRIPVVQEFKAVPSVRLLDRQP